MAILAGAKVVALVATPEALVAASTATSSVIVQAKRANTGSVYLGSAAAQEFELQPGASAGLDVTDLAEIYVRVDVAGEGVAYLGAN